MTGESVGVGPEQDLGADRVWDKQTVGWPSARVGLVSLGPSHRGLDLPDEGGEEAGGGQDGV